MDSILSDFLVHFRNSFSPPTPRWNGSNWLVSKVWSDYIRAWLPQHYRVSFEYPIVGGGALDAAVWSKTGQKTSRIDIALEWEWDNNKAEHIALVDFPKCLQANAQCGLAIKQTRADGRRGLIQADDTVMGLYDSCKNCRRDDRSLALIDIRRMHQTRDRVEFTIYFHDLVEGKKEEVRAFSLP